MRPLIYYTNFKLTKLNYTILYSSLIICYNKYDKYVKKTSLYIFIKLWTLNLILQHFLNCLKP